MAVAVVISAFFVGQLTAPLIGSLADRKNAQRQVFLGSFPIMAAAAVAFGLSHSVVLWVLAALVAGAAAGAAQTTGSVFIVEGHPREFGLDVGQFALGVAVDLGLMRIAVRVVSDRMIAHRTATHLHHQALVTQDLARAV